MHIQENVSLSGYSAMRLGGPARYLAEAGSEDKLVELVEWAKSKKLPFIVIGHGSNIIWRDEGYEGLVIVNKIMGLEFIEEDNETATLRAGAGELWDDVVAKAVDKDLTGIEFLSAIPGTAGAAPVQNIGAYGAELASTLVEVEAYDTQTKSFGGMASDSCDFSYRNSRFKSSDKGQFIITGIVLRLKKGHPEPPFYESLQKYFDENQIKEFTPKAVRQAVIAIRKIKLPDPSVVANNGSFFTNPFVDETKFRYLKSKYPDIKGWPDKSGRVKLAAGWLLEQAGFKDYQDTDTGMRTWPNHALVLVNDHAKSTNDLLAFRKKILDGVNDKFDVSLEQEPELLP
jgi:UDP-N-acetylmuramate dehydrogenase